jgi:hypothetical protein
MKTIFALIFFVTVLLLTIIAGVIEALAKLVICLCFFMCFPIVSILYPFIKNIESDTIGFIYEYATNIKGNYILLNIIKKHYL